MIFLSYSHNGSVSLFCCASSRNRYVTRVDRLVMPVNPKPSARVPNGWCKLRLRPQNPQSRELHRRSRQFDAMLGPAHAPAPQNETRRPRRRTVLTLTAISQSARCPDPIMVASMF
jgi:hypothetical protein